MPRPGNARMQLMPTLLRPPCSAVVIWKPSPLAPITTSLAGALCTPRCPSVRHLRPPARPVRAAPQPRHVAGRRDRHLLVGERVLDLDPGVVERRELGVV